MDGLPRLLTGTAAIGSAAAGGVFLGFSTIVMPALRRLPGREGLVAMQQINKAAPASPIFMVTLLGTGALSAALGALAATRIRAPYAGHILIGTALHLGSIVVTSAYHVPRNEALARLDPTAPESPDQWRRYLNGWTAWNHVRAALPVAASAVYVVALHGRTR